ncbi:extracellular solute-binding protein [Paenibacillus sp. SGZ-1009]|uniref:extracellular solute-binding protein n=1 Tax=Paenibacillus campi TaxID=3106031 RepID=UPI002AFDF5FB|nr:extracellular solute-binding protein [Paenibacillus sp. SGZ-1009]
MFTTAKWSSLLLIVLSIALLAGCSGKSGSEAASANGTGTTEISLYTSGSLNVKELWETLIPEFEKANPTIKVKLVYLPSGTGGQSAVDRLLAAKQSGQQNVDVDLYEGGLDDITRGNSQGIWAKLDSSAIPNLSNVDSNALKQANDLAVPYRASSVVLAYDSSRVSSPPKTADELYAWIRQHPGRFAYNDPATGGSGNSFVDTAIYNFLPADAMTSSDPAMAQKWDKGFNLLKELGPYMYQKGVYPKKNQGTLDLLASGEVDMIPAWSDMALEQLNKQLLPSTVKLTQINPPFTGGSSYLMIPAMSAKKEAAEKLLNYVLTPEAQTIIVNKMYGYPGIKWSLMPKDLQSKFASVSGGYRQFNSGDLQKEINQRWQSEVAGQ